MNSAPASLADGLSVALARVKEAIRADAANPSHRAAYFQLLCVAGDWDRAADQLRLMESVDPESALFAQAYYRAIRCEAERAMVARGEADPIVFGEPAEWVGSLIEGFRLGLRGEWASALQLRDVAYEAAPTTPGTANGEAIEWIADADSRFGPVLEAFIDGHYRWVPFERIQRLEIHAPRHVIDAIWLPAKFTWTNQGAVDGLIPARYAGSENHLDEAVKAARQTRWEEKVEGYFVGFGQKTFATDLRDLALLELKEITQTSAVAI